MPYRKTLKNLTIFADKIQDNESRNLFDLRLQYCIKRNPKEFLINLDKILLSSKDGCYSCWRLKQYEQRNVQNEGKNIVIFGAGMNGQITCRSLKYVNREMDCFVR